MKNQMLNLQEKLQESQKKQLIKNLINKIYYLIATLCLPIQYALADVAKKSEPNIVLQKFAYALFLVIFFAVLIYAILYLYKKIFSIKDSTSIKMPNANSLESAKDLNEAVRIFLEKTKPNQ